MAAQMNRARSAVVIPIGAAKSGRARSTYLSQCCSAPMKGDPVDDKTGENFTCSACGAGWFFRF